MVKPSDLKKCSRALEFKTKIKSKTWKIISNCSNVCDIKRNWQKQHVWLRDTWLKRYKQIEKWTPNTFNNLKTIKNPYHLQSNTKTHEQLANKWFYLKIFFKYTIIIGQKNKTTLSSCRRKDSHWWKSKKKIKNKRNDKRFNNRNYSLFFLNGHLSEASVLILNILK